MEKRAAKQDFAQNAIKIVEISTGVPLKTKEKNTAAVSLGRLGGGLKGGRARADRLTSDQRSEIAQKAARARWARKKG